jgi:thiamine-phosphate pyrophosphorylase
LSDGPLFDDARPALSRPPRLYLITDRHATGGRPLVDVVSRALAGVPRREHGGKAASAPVAVQLREKDLSGRQLFELAVSLREVTRAAGAALFVNDRVDVALAAGADGVHLTESSLSVAAARAVAPGLAIAVSTHDRATVEKAARAGAGFVVFGPVFDTPSKRGMGDPTGLETLRAACTLGVPVLAIGGITPARVGDCVRAGCAGVACIRAVLSAPDGAEVTRKFLFGFKIARQHF